MDLTTDTPTSADKIMEMTAERARTNLLFAEEELGKRLLDDTISTKQLLDIAEHSYKVSGMAKKQEVVEDTGRVIFQILLGDSSTNFVLEKAVEGEVVPDTVESLAENAAALLGDIPAYVSSSENSPASLENLTFDEDFE